jgi:hypothetical protein
LAEAVAAATEFPTAFVLLTNWLEYKFEKPENPVNPFIPNRSNGSVFNVGCCV